MGSRPGRPINVATTRKTRRRRHCRNQRLPSSRRRSVPSSAVGRRESSSVTDKLEALKNLIPVHNAGGVKSDELFQETADYILLLRTQVSLLQRLVDFYGSSSENQNVAVQ